MNEHKYKVHRLRLRDDEIQIIAKALHGLLPHIKDPDELKLTEFLLRRFGTWGRIDFPPPLRKSQFYKRRRRLKPENDK